MWNLRRWSEGLIYKTEMKSHVGNKILVTKGDERGGINWKIKIDIHMLPL